MCYMINNLMVSINRYVMEFYLWKIILVMLKLWYDCKLNGLFDIILLM